jgi:hypothetical protein
MPFLITLMVGCISPPGAKPLSDVRPSPTGATLYVLEEYEDLVDSICPVDLVQRHPLNRNVGWFGEQAFPTVLSYIARHSNGQLLHMEFFQPREGQESRVFIPEPVHFMTPIGEGRFELRHHPEPAGLDLAMTPVLTKAGTGLSLKYSFREIFPVRSKIPGTEFEAGEPVMVNAVFGQTLDQSPLEIPMGATLLFVAPKGHALTRILLLHIASVESK